MDHLSEVGLWADQFQQMFSYSHQLLSVFYWIASQLRFELLTNDLNQTVIQLIINRCAALLDVPPADKSHSLVCKVCQRHDTTCVRPTEAKAATMVSCFNPGAVS